MYMFKRIYVSCRWREEVWMARGTARRAKTLYYIAVCDFNYKVKPFAGGNNGP